MRNRLTFANIISILLENKKKTYQQHQLVRSLFSAYLNDELPSSEIYAEDNTMYSRWCTGARPIPMEILRIYEENNFEVMEEDFRCKIIPNLINESQARSQIEELINDSRNIIGNKTANEILALTDNAAFFTAAVRYAILSDHEHSGLFSPDLSDTIQSSRLPSITEEFVGRKNELKECGKLLQEHPTLFISGVAGIGKSEFAKYYADKNRKKYTNLIYLYYTGDLKKNIAGMEFDNDTSEMTEEMLFDKHYKILKKLHRDSLIILDNFNALPKDDSFFREFAQNDFQLLITTRCRPTQYPIMELKELDTDTELSELFFRLCPSAKEDTLATKQIIHTVHSHTLTVAKQVLASYENLVLEHEGTQTLDNGVCQMMYGAIALSEGNAKEAELHLLSAENIISEVMGTDNDYAKTVYLYLNNLYSRWQKPEQALAYKNKYLECSHQR